MPWDDVATMVSAYERQLASGHQTWSLFSYRDASQYMRKLRWYAGVLRGLSDETSVLDVGCGTGELLAWVALPQDYRGVDAVPGFVARARERFPARRFEVRDVLSESVAPADVVVMVGILGVSPQPFDLITRACMCSTDVLLFDYLSKDRAIRRPARLRYLGDAAVADRLAACGFELRAEQTLGAASAVSARRRDQLSSSMSAQIRA